MSTRTSIALLISGIVNAVLFGVGATVVLTAKPLAANATTLLPLVIVASLLFAPVIAWRLAPMMRARFQRQVATKERLLSSRAYRAPELR